MTDTRTKAQRVIPERLHYVHGYGFAIGSQAINVGGDGEITDAKQSLLDAYNGMREALLAIPDDPAPQPTPTERDVIQWVSDTVGLSTDNEREMARRLAALRGGDAERAVLLELREAIQEREDANQRNWRAGITPCKDPAILHGCSVANNDVIEIIDRLLAAAPDQADAGKVEPAAPATDDTRTKARTDAELLGSISRSNAAWLRALERKAGAASATTFTVSEGVGECVPSRETDADREARAVLGKITPEQIAEGEQAVRDGKWISTTDLRKELDADREARIVEALAELEHDQWMHWAKTLTEKEPLLSAERVARWKTCMVPYSELTEEMKEHDRVWARKAVAIVSECAAVDAEIAEIRQERIGTAPASRSVSDLLAEVSRLTTERNEALAECDRLRVALDEREGDMHVRIRAGYDKTVADSWRAEVERLTRERDTARKVAIDADEAAEDVTRQRDEARAELDEARNVVADANAATNECERWKPMTTDLHGTVREMVNELQRLTRERDEAWERHVLERGGWAALEKLRDALRAKKDRNSDLDPWGDGAEYGLNYGIDAASTLLAARPNGKERADG